MGKTLLLTGRPGVGKTTVVKAVAAALGEGAGGFYTQEMREGTRRTGFRLVALHGGQATLANVKFSPRRGPRVGRYVVDVSAVDRLGVLSIEEAVQRGRVVIIDEIGKMELFSPTFKAAVLMAVLSPSPVVATAMAAHQPWVDRLKSRPGVTVWTVTPQNRDDLPARILTWLAG